MRKVEPKKAENGEKMEEGEILDPKKAENNEKMEEEGESKRRGSSKEKEMRRSKLMKKSDRKQGDQSCCRNPALPRRRRLKSTT